MTYPKKQKRPYNSARRQAQARQTRQQIMVAARTLFLQRGYAGATVEAIAQEAGVAPETIYSIFGNKRKILAHLLDVSVGGDDTPVPLLERAEPQAVLQEKDQHRQLMLFARDITTIMERTAPILEIMRIAAKTEPDIAELLQGALDNRWQNMNILVQRLVANGALREGLNTTQATDIIWTLTSAEVFRLFQVERGWTTDYYIVWLGESLIRLLLP